jgi:hypothetical protein
MNQMHTLHSDFLIYILILSSHMLLVLPSGPFPSGFLPRCSINSWFLSSVLLETAVLFPLSVVLRVSGQEYKSQSSSSYSFLQTAPTLSVLHLDIRISMCYSSMCRKGPLQTPGQRVQSGTHKMGERSKRLCSQCDLSKVLVLITRHVCRLSANLSC